MIFNDSDDLLRKNMVVWERNLGHTSADDCGVDDDCSRHGNCLIFG